MQVMKMRQKLGENPLNPNVGLTDLDDGRSAYLSGVLTPYKVLVEPLQRSTMSEQHLAGRRIRTFYMVMQASWVGTKDTESVSNIFRMD